jgi:hypothetical protein
VKALDDAVLERLRSDPALSNSVFMGGSVSGKPERYVVVWANSGARSADRLEGSQINVTKTYTIHSVGMSVEQARAVNARVMELLLNWRPSVAGWMSQRLKHEVSRPAAVDRDVTPWQHYFVDQFDLYSVPARLPVVS